MVVGITTTFAIRYKSM